MIMLFIWNLLKTLILIKMSASHLVIDDTADIYANRMGGTAIVIHCCHYNEQ